MPAKQVHSICEQWTASKKELWYLYILCTHPRISISDFLHHVWEHVPLLNISSEIRSLRVTRAEDLWSETLEVQRIGMIIKGRPRFAIARFGLIRASIIGASHYCCCRLWELFMQQTQQTWQALPSCKCGYPSGALFAYVITRFHIQSTCFHAVDYRWLSTDCHKQQGNLRQLVLGAFVAQISGRTVKWIELLCGLLGSHIIHVNVGSLFRHIIVPLPQPWQYLPWYSAACDQELYDIDYGKHNSVDHFSLVFSLSFISLFEHILFLSYTLRDFPFRTDASETSSCIDVYVRTRLIRIECGRCCFLPEISCPFIASPPTIRI